MEPSPGKHSCNSALLRGNAAFQFLDIMKVCPLQEWTGTALTFPAMFLMLILCVLVVVEGPEWVSEDQCHSHPNTGDTTWMPLSPLRVLFFPFIKCKLVTMRLYAHGNSFTCHHYVNVFLSWSLSSKRNPILWPRAQAKMNIVYLSVCIYVCTNVHKCVGAHVCQRLEDNFQCCSSGANCHFFLSLCLTQRHADMGRELSWVLNSMVVVQFSLDLLNNPEQIIIYI